MTRYLVADVPVDAIKWPDLLAGVSDAVVSRESAVIYARDLNGLLLARSDRELRVAHSEAAWVLPDGRPLFFALRLIAGGDAEHLTGPDTMLRLIESGIGLGWRHYLFGGSEEALTALDERLRAAYPTIQIAGMMSPPYGGVEELSSNDIAREIDSSGADIVWVFLGCPKQELWAKAMKPRLRTGAIITVGAALDFHAGTVRRAPLWMRRYGMEWLHRCFQEPRRLVPRYLRILQEGGAILIRNLLKGGAPLIVEAETLKGKLLSSSSTNIQVSSSEASGGP